MVPLILIQRSLPETSSFLIEMSARCLKTAGSLVNEVRLSDALAGVLVCECTGRLPCCGRRCEVSRSGRLWVTVVKPGALYCDCRLCLCAVWHLLTVCRFAERFVGRYYPEDCS